MGYIDGSYTAIGQDGLHFNQSVNDPPTNTSAPSDVIEALYGNSDHLPISIKLKIEKTLGFPEYEHSLFTELSFNNPVAEVLELNIRAKANTDVRFEIINMSGIVLFSDERKVVTGQNKIYYNKSPRHFLSSRKEKQITQILLYLNPNYLSVSYIR